MSNKSIAELDQDISDALDTCYADAQLPQLLGLPFRNTEIHQQLKKSDSLSSLFLLLLEKGTFDFNFESVEWVDTDGEQQTLTINRASMTPMWPMGTNFWVRDNAIIADRLLNLDYDSFPYPIEWRKKGKEILLSTLTIMASVRQIERFETIISGEKNPSDSIHWPHIFLSIKSNLNAAEDEPWMHKQDAWQMLCCFVLDALSKAQISLEDLSEKQKRVLELAAPFLEKIQFTSSPNGGSWEEVEAIRTSVLTWDTALLEKLTHSPFATPIAKTLSAQGKAAILKQLPHECPAYPTNSPLYREADAALIYTLSQDLIDWKEHTGLLNSLLTTIESLKRPYGIIRYTQDSYQGLDYYSNRITEKLNEMYASPSGDSSGVEAFMQRGELVPHGEEAQWTHFVWQLSTAYGKLAHRTDNPAFYQKQKEWFYFGVSLITGTHEVSIFSNTDQKMEVSNAPAFQLPECYNASSSETQKHRYPSMHTPLYWSVAECLAAFDASIRTTDK